MASKKATEVKHAQAVVQIDSRPYWAEIENNRVVKLIPVDMRRWTGRNAEYYTKEAVNAAEKAIQTDGKGGLLNPKLSPYAEANPSPAFGQYEPPEVDTAFAKQLQSVLLDNKYDRLLPRRKRGKLDDKNLSRVAVGSVNIFKQKQARKGKSYNVVLLVDVSGSMYGDKIEQASQTAVFLAANFEHLNINLEVIAFNHFVAKLKGWNDKLEARELHAVLNDMVAGKHKSGATYNNDLDAIAYAYKELTRQQAETGGTNLLVLISDGNPASSASESLEGYFNNERPETYTDRLGHVHYAKDNLDAKLPDNWRHRNTAIANYITKHRTIAKTVGIGLLCECRQAPPADRLRVESVEQLKPVILKWLRANIRRGE